MSCLLQLLMIVTTVIRHAPAAIGRRRSHVAMVVSALNVTLPVHVVGAVVASAFTRGYAPMEPTSVTGNTVNS